MEEQKKILFAGTTSSGSSALFDYFRCFPNTCAIVSEMPLVWRKNLYPKWKKDEFNHSNNYKKELNQAIINEANKRFGNKLNGSVLLLNNVVTCLTLQGVDLLDNIKIFCVIRDPRSTWLRRRDLAIKNNINISVEKFILEYKNQRETFKSNLKQINKNRENIYIINFEDFILDKDYKNKAIQLAGFNINNYPDQPKHKPWPKEQTILRHQFYENQEEISLIKKELEEYCHEKV